MASTSSGINDAASGLIAYPAPLANYEDVVANPQLFMTTLEQLHTSMRTKFMIPIIGGKELDLHRLFKEVTHRGGMAKIVRDRRWKEVTDISQNPSVTPGPAPSRGTKRKSAEGHTAVLQQPQITSELPGVSARTPSPSGEDTAVGIIDGKFENGYLVMINIGTEQCRGVLYHAPGNPGLEIPPGPQNHSMLVNKNDNASAAPVPHRRRRRKKSEIKRRDPAHPKPNRSGYNFFFAEQHARLKPLHPGKDREISRMIGELWNKLKECEKSVYQEKAVKDKERYKEEMEKYREGLRTGQVISDAVPLQQRLPEAEPSVETDSKVEETEAGESPETGDDSNETSSSKSLK